MSLFACINKNINSIEEENIFLSIFLDYYYFLFLLWFPFSIFTCSIKKIICFWFSKDNITFEYSSLFNDDTWFNAVKNSLIQVLNILFETWKVYYKSQFIINIRIVLY